MIRLSAVCCLIAGWLLCGVSRVDAGFEWWHHLYDMDRSIEVCMESCYHIDDVGAYTPVTRTVRKNIELGSLNIETPLNVTCYDAGRVTVTGSAATTRSMTVSASDHKGEGASVTAIGEAAKNAVGYEIGWSCNWGWETQATYNESCTLTGQAEHTWPEHGERKVLEPGAKLTSTVKIFGDQATITLYAFNEHRCYTTVYNPRYVNGTCGGRTPGVYYTTYSDDGTVRFSATSSGVHPKRVSVGPPMESGMIQVGCHVVGE